jgi:hypothetical protein
MSAPPLLNIRGLSKIFVQIPVLDRIDIAVAQSEIVMIIERRRKIDAAALYKQHGDPIAGGNIGGWGQHGWREPQR